MSWLIWWVGDRCESVVGRESVGAASFVNVLPSICHQFVMVSGVEPRTTGTSMQSTMFKMLITNDMFCNILLITILIIHECIDVPVVRLRSRWQLSMTVRWQYDDSSPSHLLSNTPPFFSPFSPLALPFHAPLQRVNNKLSKVIEKSILIPISVEA